MSGPWVPLVPILLAAVGVVESDLVDAGAVGLRGGLLVLARGALLVRTGGARLAAAFAERNANLCLLGLRPR